VDLAIIYRDAQLMAETVEAFRIAVRQFPERARAHSGLGKALSQSVISKLATENPVATLEESIAEFNQAAALDRRNVTTHRWWGKAVEALAELRPDGKAEYLEEMNRLDGIIAALTAPKATERLSPFH
jgi:hypothetical protein